MVNKQQQGLDHFKAGRTLTVSECYYLYKTHDLRRIVSRLNKGGHQITGEYETSPDGTESYKRYTINQDALHDSELARL